MDQTKVSANAVIQHLLQRIAELEFQIALLKVMNTRSHPSTVEEEEE